MAVPARSPALLPPAAAAFLRRRAVEATGVSLALAGLALGLALASYDPADPSLNAAASATPRIVLGGTGAVVADVLMQSIGLAAPLLAVALAAWGWRVATHRGLGRLWLRVSALPPALLASAVALAHLPRFAAWPVAAGL